MFVAKHARRLIGSFVVIALVCVAGCPPIDDAARNPPPGTDEPNLAIRADDYSLGRDTAAVTVIEYGDFQCPVCGRFERDTFPTIRREYVDTGRVRWVFRHFPLRNIHPQAESAGRAAECAAQQGKFWEYHSQLFANQSALGDADLTAYGNAAGLNIAAFDACRASDAVAARVQRDVDSGLALGVAGTPTFFINGERLTGFRSVEVFRATLDAALAPAAN